MNASNRGAGRSGFSPRSGIYHLQETVTQTSYSTAPRGNRISLLTRPIRRSRRSSSLHLAAAICGVCSPIFPDGLHGSHGSSPADPDRTPAAPPDIPSTWVFLLPGTAPTSLRRLRPVPPESVIEDDCPNRTLLRKILYGRYLYQYHA
jgi:hypothetical protein